MVRSWKNLKTVFGGTLPPFFIRALLGLCLLHLCSSVFLLVGPLLSKSFFDESLAQKDFPVFLRCALGGAAAFLLSLGSAVAADILREKSGTRSRIALARLFAARLYAQELAFFRERSVGELSYRWEQGESLAEALWRHLPSFCADLLRAPILLGLAFWANRPMSVAFLLLSPLVLVEILSVRAKALRLFETVWERQERLSRQVHESLANITVVKALGLEGRQRRQYLRLFLDALRLRAQSVRLRLLHTVSAAFLTKGVYAAISLLGAWLMLKGTVSLGGYTAALLSLAQLGVLLQGLGTTGAYLGEQELTLEKYAEVIARAPHVADRAGRISPQPLNGPVQLQEVWFGYRPRQPVLCGVSCAFEPGTWSALVGPSGSGKSTLLFLLLRLYDPQRGTILINGNRMEGIALACLRRFAAAALQEPFLFDATIRENIVCGLAPVTEEQLREAVRLADMETFINGLPERFDTRLGENAAALSQGYKQRLCLARALVREPQLLILDEAFSAIDLHGQERIRGALRAARRGKITLLVTHRLSAAAEADRVYFLAGAGTLKSGSHEQLLRQDTAYAAFFSRQGAR